MKITDIITEDTEGSTADYQRMLNFVRNSKIQGVPPDQQVAVALYRELEKQQAKNAELGAELSAAEKRIDVATQGSELQQQQLGKHATELEKERGNIAQQQAAMGKLDAASAEREKASRSQLKDLTDKLEAVKSKPGVDPEIAKRLEKEITQLKNNGIGADKVRELEATITNIQQQRQVDDSTMNDLLAKVNDAQAAAKELEKTKQDLGQSIEKTTADAQDQIQQIKQQLAHFREIERTVSALEPMVTDVIAPKIRRLENDSLDTDATIGELEQTVSQLGTALSARQAAAQGRAAQMTQPVRKLPAPNPQQIAQKFVRSGDLTPVAEDRFLQSIRWATGK